MMLDGVSTTSSVPISWTTLLQAVLYTQISVTWDGMLWAENLIRLA